MFCIHDGAQINIFMISNIDVVQRCGKVHPEICR
jgi:hypothetical protein